MKIPLICPRNILAAINFTSEPAGLTYRTNKGYPQALPLADFYFFDYQIGPLK